MNWLIKFKLGIMACLVLASPLRANPIIFALTDSRLAGECDQIRGVTYALVQKFQKEKKVPEIRTLDLQGGEDQNKVNFSSLVDLPRDNPEAIFISSGVYGIRAFRMLRESYDAKGIFVYISHQIIGNEDDPSSVQLKSLANIVDFIALPHHVFEVSDPLATALKDALKGSKTHLLEVTGVVHNMHAEDILKAVEEHGKTMPVAEKYMLVILGGDVQNNDGKTWTYYTPQEAEKLAQYVNVQMINDPDLFVLVTNAPRTGRFDPATGKDANFHEKGGPLDPVTVAFMKGLSDKTRVQLYNFEKGALSLFKALLGLIQKKEGVVFGPGESSSMNSQMIDNMSPGSVTLYTHGAMKEIHKAHVTDEFMAGRVSLLEAAPGERYTFIGLNSHSKEPARAASESVADAIWAMLLEQGEKKSD
ncbi:MAG: hypothetical protein B7Y25_05960 [Alphaproteobacteria bacterium 16-39-46]|nr:MAG: hypothetical protein B7Y25_05960 [Alphaproteobacteria bacterium 16-39-46]OZA42441.1 MAG: hypothetical protein B7X84_06010 [Alphaproteobacteria bacterium 17-39-52]HQS84445.1 ELM1/GtrOC1 family putative glycosyltransferase [Alphaproteobacteria bacterium]HQS94251.1 ELM1/GtrOC1 family putative glycosyltransferase [Alphaproteobacteria bacterium]